MKTPESERAAAAEKESLAAEEEVGAVWEG